jgi:hypothetical protein
MFLFCFLLWKCNLLTYLESIARDVSTPSIIADIVYKNVSRDSCCIWSFWRFSVLLYRQRVVNFACICITRTEMYVCTCMYVCMHVCMHVCMLVCMYVGVCMYVCMYVYTTRTADHTNTVLFYTSVITDKLAVTNNIPVGALCLRLIGIYSKY